MAKECGIIGFMSLIKKTFYEKNIVITRLPGLYCYSITGTKQRISTTSTSTSTASTAANNKSQTGASCNRKR